MVDAAINVHALRRASRGRYHTINSLVPPLCTSVVNPLILNRE